MRHRRKARELAVQALYYMDMRQNASHEALDLFEFCVPPEKKSHEFFRALVLGVLENRPALDEHLEQFSEHWKVERMACVDRNIMRIAAYEMLFLTDIPPKVSINEAIELGKFFGTDESGAFINGILDGIHNAWLQRTVAARPDRRIAVPRIMPRETPVRPPAADDGRESYARVQGRPGLIRRRGRSDRKPSPAAEASAAFPPDPETEQGKPDR